MSKPSYSPSLTLDTPSGEAPTGTSISSTSTWSSFPTPTDMNPGRNSTETGTRTTTSRVATPTFPTTTPTITNSERSGKHSTNISIETVFYFIAFLVIMVAIVYVIDMARRSRKRRRLARVQNQDPEAPAQSGYSSTYRPQNEEDGSPPPQYLAYAFDQPYVDPEMDLLYPDQAHCRMETHGSTGPASSQQGLIRSSSLSAGIAGSSMMGDHPRPLHTTANTTATTPTATSMIPRSITAPNANNIMVPDTDAVACVTINQDQTQPLTSRIDNNNSNNGSSGTTSNNNGASVPVISAPSPAFSFTSGGPWSRLRSGLERNGRRQNRNTSRNSVTNAPTTAATTTAATAESRPVSQTIRSSELLLTMSSTLAGDQETGAEVGSSTAMTERSSGRGSGILHPSLLRLRSQGPPPYVPLATDNAPPQLPPEYNAAVATPV
ncbi:hypothetical protein BGZ51_004181 [Haplosporangium sp. Z 767]|nr:hypothetical protein BGZ51_004181 [Haplosporangium sp. Z 767]KAF9183440.1 hypothetical protein BGZ50_004243 [Haplosporangium sp. Z 11]